MKLIRKKNMDIFFHAIIFLRLYPKFFKMIPDCPPTHLIQVTYLIRAKAVNQVFLLQPMPIFIMLHFISLPYNPHNKNQPHPLPHIGDFRISPLSGLSTSCTLGDSHKSGNCAQRVCPYRNFSLISLPLLSYAQSSSISCLIIIRFNTRSSWHHSFYPPHC